MKFKSLTIGSSNKVYNNVGISISENGTALVFDVEKVVAQLQRVKLLTMAKNVIHMDGMEPCGMDKSGRNKYKYEEWFLVDGND